MATKQLNTWCFTWNSNSDTDYVGPSVDTLKKVLEENFAQWVFQQEQGENTSRFHLQGHLKLPSERKEVKSTILYMLGTAYNNDVTHLTVSPTSNNGIATGGSAFYCMKVDRVSGPWCDESHSFTKKRKYLANDLKCMENPFPWQQTILDRISGQDNDRRIMWIYNKTGNAGKSKLMKYCCYNKDKYDATRLGLGTATQMKEAACAEGPHNTWFVDIPRVTGNQESQRDLFSALEEIKTGWVKTSMYGKPKEMFQEPPHVIIMSNSLPNMSLCSADRWEIWILENGEIKPFDGASL